MTYTREQIEVAAQNAAECGPVQQAIIRQLLAENDALREDAERLDWMESKGRVSIERVREGRIDGPLRWDVEFGHYGREAKSKKGFRQAIDAARKKD